MTEFSVEQVRLMRSEISDDEFAAFIGRNPGNTWHLDRPLFLNGGDFVIEDTLFVVHGEHALEFPLTESPALRLVRRPL